MNEFEMMLLEQCQWYRKEILPLREKADRGEGGYEQYDEACSNFLEAFYWRVERYFVNNGKLEDI